MARTVMEVSRWVLFRVDAGDVIGYGHIMRSIGLAEEFLKRGIDSVFVSRRIDGSAQHILSKTPFKLVEVPRDVPPEAEPDIILNEIIRRYGTPSLVIIDGYHIHPEGWTCYSRVAPLMVTDVFGGLDYTPAKIVYNGYANANKLDYSKVYGSTLTLLGPQYLIIRDSIRQLRGMGNRVPTAGVNRILVNGGGVDEHDVCGSIAEALTLNSDSLLPVELHFVTGQNYPFAENLGKKLEALKRVRWHIQPSNWHELLASMDLVILAGGSTIYEAACLGIPALVFLVEENQRGSATAMESEGTLRVGGVLKEMTTDAIAGHITTVLNDTHWRTGCAERGPGVVDGNGVLRVADASLQLINT